MSKLFSHQFGPSPTSAHLRDVFRLLRVRERRLDRQPLERLDVLALRLGRLARLGLGFRGCIRGAGIYTIPLPILLLQKLPYRHEVRILHYTNS